ncbi:MAG TPA: glycosyltransferase, partial [Acidimicrobiales bacterium]|nr:glycosyltransferase [Acidimicrobiales bacterium]
RGDTGAVLIYHLATESRLADLVRARPEPLVVDYHNVTPARYFRSWDPHQADDLTLARWQLGSLADRAALGLGDSSVNVAELRAAGYAPTAVVPILFDPARLGGEPDPATLAALARAKEGGGADLLFVGRLAPNKAQHDLIKVLVAYRTVYDPAARLHLVGRPAAARYATALGDLARRAGVAGAVHIVDQGVPPSALAAYYRTADVLVSCSEHEGFCVPVLEAFQHGVPVVAHAAAAVPETVGDAGILVPTKAPLAMAAAIDRVLADATLREELVAAGRARLRSFDVARSRALLASALSDLVDVAPRAGGGVRAGAG